MAARREHPLILAWQALFNGYWNSKKRRPLEHERAKSIQKHPKTTQSH